MHKTITAHLYTRPNYMVQGAGVIEPGLSGPKNLLSNLIQIIKFIQKQRSLFPWL